MRVLISLLTSRISISLVAVAIVYVQLTYFKLKLEYYTQKIHNLKSQVSYLKSENQDLKSRLEYIKSKLSACEISKENLENTIDKLVKEKDLLISRIVKLHQSNLKLKRYRKVNITNTTIKVEVNPDDEVTKVFNLLSSGK